MQLLGINKREGVFEVDAVDGMEVDSCFETQQSGVALSVLIGTQPFLHHQVDALGEDVVLDVVGKESHLCRNVLRGKVESQVCLPAVLWLQVWVTQFVAQCSFVHTVRTQFTHVGSTEATSHIQSQVEVLTDITYSSDAARKAAEVSRVEVQVAIVEAQTTIQRPFAQRFAQSGIAADIEELVLRDERFFTQVL